MERRGEERKGDEVDEAQLHVVLGVVDLYLKLWGRIADAVMSFAEPRSFEFGLPCQGKATTSHFSTSLS